MLIGVPGLVFLSIGLVSLLVVLGIFNETRQLPIGTALFSAASTMIGLIMIFGAMILYSMSRWRRQLEGNGSDVGNR